jgi:hypothetical protein
MLNRIHRCWKVVQGNDPESKRRNGDIRLFDIVDLSPRSLTITVRLVMTAPQGHMRPPAAALEFFQMG